MSNRDKFLPIVQQIAERYGRVIDLQKSPFVMIEILRSFGHALDEEGGGGSGGGGGVGSTIAVGITPPESGEQIDLADVMKVLLSLQRDVKKISAQLGRAEPLK